jgi:hypothetical protein
MVARAGGVAAVAGSLAAAVLLVAVGPARGSDWPLLPSPWAGPGWVTDAGGANESPPDAGTALRPSGIQLVGGSGSEGVVADGTGDIWVDGAWQVTRVDPVTGRSDEWDAADDVAFALVERLAPAEGAGVWLVEHHRARLFDGNRFLLDLEVPPEYRGDASVDAFVQRGDEVWIGSRSGAARWSGGSWSLVGLGELASVVSLAVASDGSVWAAGDLIAAGGRRSTVVRFDGTRWAAPGAGPQPTAVLELATDPTGGVVARRRAPGAAVYRFEAGRWTDLTPGLAATQVGHLAEQSLALGRDGRVWVAGRGGVATRLPLSSWRTVAGDGWTIGMQEGTEPVGLAVVDGVPFVADSRGLVRLAGPAAQRVWQDPGLRGTGALADRMPEGAALAGVSHEEAWIQPFSWFVSPTTRLRLGAWSEVPPPDDAWWNGVLGGVPVVASDGAVWAIGGTGLVRREGAGTDWQVVLEDVTPGRAADSTPVLLAGAGGSVWLQEVGSGDWSGWGRLRAVRPDGTTIAVPAPGPGLMGGRDAQGADRAALAAGPDGSLWAVVTVRPSSGAIVPVVLRWRAGRWQRVTEVPGRSGWVDSSIVTGSGALWVSVPGPQGLPARIARFADGLWSDIAVGLSEPRALGEEVCGLAGQPAWPGFWLGSGDASRGGREVLCVGGDPLTLRRLVAPPVRAMDVAPDGTVWLLGEQLARVSD